MVKVSITFPNSAQITLESEESGIIHEVVGIVLRDLPKDLMRLGPDTGEGTVSQKGISVDNHEITLGPSVATDQPGHAPTTQHEPTRAPRPSRQTATSHRTVPAGRPSAAPSITQEKTPNIQGDSTAEFTDAFVKFCGSASPMGDMRRVVVATEGAHRFFGVESVDAEDLARLFEMAEWRCPHNFTQTLRNAARDKFRWLERVPGRAGRYAVTDLGRAVTLSESLAPKTLTLDQVRHRVKELGIKTGDDSTTWIRELRDAR